jgi:hypothetical protein
MSPAEINDSYAMEMDAAFDNFEVDPIEAFRLAEVEADKAAWEYEHKDDIDF